VDLSAEYQLNLAHIAKNMKKGTKTNTNKRQFPLQYRFKIREGSPEVTQIDSQLNTLIAHVQTYKS